MTLLETNKQPSTGAQAWIEQNKAKLEKGRLSLQILEARKIVVQQKVPRKDSEVVPKKPERSVLSKIIEAAGELPGTPPPGVTPKTT